MFQLDFILVYFKKKKINFLKLVINFSKLNIYNNSQENLNEIYGRNE